MDATDGDYGSDHGGKVVDSFYWALEVEEEFILTGKNVKVLRLE